MASAATSPVSSSESASAARAAAAPAPLPLVVDLIDQDVGVVEAAAEPAPASVATAGSSEPPGGEVVDDELARVIELSTQTAHQEEEIRRQWQLQQQQQLRSNDDQNDTFASSPCRRRLPRREFDETIEAVVAQNGGWNAIDESVDVKLGNMKFRCADVAEGGGAAQGRAQYGRYTVQGYWRVIDVLEGRSDVDWEGGDDDEDGGTEEDDRKPAAASAASPLNEDDDRKSAAATASILASDVRNDSPIDPPKATATSRKRRRSNPLPHTSLIRAHVDIGHGIGIQVQQAGFGLGIPSRGVELMTRRNSNAHLLLQEVIGHLRRDPPDASQIDMRCDDFTKAVLFHKETGRRDEALRAFLLCRDLPDEQQRGLVMFVNNAHEVFGARADNKDGACLDSLLAELFANMKVGGRIVTLTDISCHLQQNTNWFRYDVFESGPEAVTWGRNSEKVYVLTKLRDDWSCQNKDCPSQQLKQNLREGERPPTSLVVDERGKLSDECIYCGGGPKRTMRKRTKNPKYDE